MLSEERRREILELLRTQGRVLVRDLSKHFHTSQITIRKDLEYLHHDGQLERTHGGALPKETGALKDSPLQEKERHHRQEKMRIAAVAARKIRPGQVVILDSGTTTTAIARACQESYDYHQRYQYCRRACRLCRRSHPYGGRIASEFLFAGRAAGRGIPQKIERGPAVSGRGRVRRQVWLDDAEPAGGARQSGHGRGSAAYGNRLRFQQIRQTQLVADYADVFRA
jgi:hypothetical protein